MLPDWILCIRAVVSKVCPRRIGFILVSTAGACAKLCTSISSRAISINARHIGVAIRPDKPPPIGALSLFPTHTPTARFGVNPIIHASRKLLVLPDFTATSRLGKWTKELYPQSGARALLSERISEICSATSRLRTLWDCTDVSSIMLPKLSSTRRIARLSTFIPSFANTPNAPVCSRSLTSPPPSTSVRPRRSGSLSVVIPKSRVSFIAFLSPVR